jgi:hypothetical protein
MIYNFDQSSISYEIVNRRTLDFIGERDVQININSANDMTHSYTIQPIISRDGRLVGPLLICLQEARGLGVRVRPRVEELVREYGNIQVYWSSSGKMDSGLILRWMREILGPEIASNLRNMSYDQMDMNSASRTLDPTYDPRDDPFVDQASLDCHQNVMRRARDQLPCMHSPNRTIQAHNESAPVAGPSWIDNPLNPEQRDQIRRDRCYAEALQAADSSCTDSPVALLLADSWGTHHNNVSREFMRQNRIYLLQIPPHTTGDVQPLDVGFFRQYKVILKTVERAALMDERIQEQRRNNQEHRRYNVMNINSLVWNQLNAPIYRDILRYAWRKTDSRYREEELGLGSPPPTANEVNFRFGNGRTCEIEGCNHTAIIKCAHCGQLLCAKHFLERVCFHNLEEHEENEFETDESSEESNGDFNDNFETVEVQSSSSSEDGSQQSYRNTRDELRA